MKEVRTQIIRTYAGWTALSALRSGSPVKSRAQVYGLLKAVPFDQLLETANRPIDAAEFAAWHHEAVLGLCERQSLLCIGTTRSLQDRQVVNRNTINKILEFQDGRSRSRNTKITDPSAYDKFKQQAPGVIRDGKKIEIWATSLSSYAACQDTMKRFNAKCVACQNVEAALNERYKTIEYGSAMRLN